MVSIRQFLRDTRGTTAIEYALIATMVSILILTALIQIGSHLQQKFYVQVSNGLN